MDVTKDMSPDEYVEAITRMVNERAVAKHPFFRRIEQGAPARSRSSRFSVGLQ